MALGGSGSSRLLTRERSGSGSARRARRQGAASSAAPAPAATATAPDAAALDEAVADAPAAIAEALDDFDFRRASDAVWRIADEANRYVNRTRPWELARSGRDPVLTAVLSALLLACQAIGTHLTPFLPDAAARITRQCTPDAAGRLPGPVPLLPRIAPPS